MVGTRTTAAALLLTTSIGTAGLAQSIFGVTGGDGDRGFDVTIPISQPDGKTTWVRAGKNWSSDDSEHTSLTFGMRMPGGNLGFSGSLDHSEADAGGAFNQVSLGAEWLGDRFELRGNLYQPLGSRSAEAPSADRVTAQPDDLSFNAGRTLAMAGADIEAGALLRASDLVTAGVFAGAYSFDHDDYGTDTGGTLRAELRVGDPGHRWQGLLSANATRSDGHTETNLTAGVRIALGGRAGARDPGRLLSRPMHRQTGIRLRTGAYGAREDLLLDGRVMRGLDEVSTGEDLAGRVTDGGVNHITFANGSFTIGDAVTLPEGHALIGGGGTVNLVSAGTDTEVALANSGPDLHLTSSRTDDDIVVMGTDTYFSGATLTGGRNGAVSNGADGLRFAGLNFENQTADALSIRDSIGIVGSDLMARGSGGDGVSIEDSSDVSLTQVDISDATQNGIRIARVDGFELSKARIHDLPLCNTNSTCEWAIYQPNLAPNAAISAIGLSNADLSDVEMDNVTYGLFVASEIVTQNWMPVITTQSHDIAVRDLAIENSRREAILAAGVDNLDLRDVKIDNTAMAQTMDLVVLQSGGTSRLNGLELAGGINGLMMIEAMDLGLSYNVEANDVMIHDTSRAGVFVNPVGPVALSDFQIADAGTNGIYLNGDSFGYAGGPITDLTLNNFNITDAAGAGVFVSGPLQDVTGDVSVTGSKTCETMMSSWMKGSLDQPGGGDLTLNGVVLQPSSDLRTTCN